MRSWRSGDVPATINLLGRATSLLPENDAWRRELLCELGVAFDAAGDTAHAEETLSGAVTSAEAAMDARSGFRAQLELAVVNYQARSGGQATKCYSMLPRRRFLRSRSSATTAVSAEPGCSQVGCMAAFTPRMRRGRKRQRELSSITAGQGSRRPRASAKSRSALLRPGARERAVNRCEELLLEEARAFGRANVGRYLGGLLAMAGAVDRGRELVERAAAAFDDLGQAGAARYCDALSRRHRAPGRRFRSARQALAAPSAPTARRARTSGCSSTAAADLAEALYWLGDYRRGRALVAIAEELTASDDIVAQSRGVPFRQSCWLDGEQADADASREEAVALAQPTEASIGVRRPSWPGGSASTDGEAQEAAEQSLKPSRSTSRRETSLLPRARVTKREAPLGASRPNSLPTSHGCSAPAVHAAVAG